VFLSKFQLARINSRTDDYEADVISASKGSDYFTGVGVFLRQGRSKIYRRNQIQNKTEIALTAQTYPCLCFADVTHNGNIRQVFPDFL